MRVIITGTGTSQGVPMVGCDCEVCRSTDPKDARLRTAAVIQTETTTLVIDTGPDFRTQLLQNKVHHFDAVLLTHEHNDHIAGLDDVRPIVYKTQRDMPVFALPRVLGCIEARFPYSFGENRYPGAPSYEMLPVAPNTEYQVGDINFTPLSVMHGNLPIVGFLFGDIAYITDAKILPESTIEKLKGIKHLVINALHHAPHPTHLNLQECLALIEQLDVQHAYLTHQSHRMGLQAEISQQLPSNVRLAYDGMVISV
jgi:phosphoribosyl 1,2-cyclic phosphate phosphodiesterase